MEEKKFCQYCGSPIDSEAKFCTKCGKSINSEQNASVQKKVYQQTNFVMDMLRNFGKPNSVIRIISIFSAIFLAIVQFFGMGYKLNIDAWIVSKTEKISAIKFLYRLVFKSGDMSEYGVKLNFLIVICCLAFIIGYVVLLIVDALLIKYIISDYHIDTIVDVDNGMSICGMVMFGVTIIIGMYIRSKLGEYGMEDIIRTIQKEQNAIIRNTKDRILVIQGAAGSGKTSVALHRIAYLLYHDRQNLKSSNILILSPNGVFSDYISHILPELGEENIQEMSFDLFAYRKLQDTAADCEDRCDQIEREMRDPKAAERFALKQSQAFVDQMDGFALELEKDGFINSVAGKGCFVAEKNLELIKEENLKKVEQYLEKAVKLSRTCGLTKDDLIDMIKIIGKDE